MRKLVQLTCLVLSFAIAGLSLAQAPAEVVALKQQYSQQLQQRAKRLSVSPHADEHLLVHTRQFIEPQLVSMGGNVHAAVGYDYSFFAFIEGQESVIAIDAGWFIPNTRHALDDYRKRVDLTTAKTGLARRPRGWPPHGNWQYQHLSALFQP